VVPIVASVEIWTTHFALGRKRWRAVRMRVIEVMFGFATFLAGIGGLALALLSRGILARPEQVLGRPADATGPGRRSIRGCRGWRILDRHVFCTRSRSRLGHPARRDRSFSAAGRSWLIRTLPTEREARNAGPLSALSRRPTVPVWRLDSGSVEVNIDRVKCVS